MIKADVFLFIVLDLLITACCRLIEAPWFESIVLGILLSGFIVWNIICVRLLFNLAMKLSNKKTG